jgi:hypothetical protein
MLQGSATIKFLFSANFNYYLDFDYVANALLVRSTADMKHYKTIPNDMLNFNDKNGTQLPGQVTAIGKNICFHSMSKGGVFEERMLRMVNKDDVDCIFKFDTENLHMLSYAKIDNNALLLKSLAKRSVSKKEKDHLKGGFGHRHNILEKSSVPASSTLVRLIQMMQTYKTKISHDATIKDKNVSSQLDQLYCIDYG